MFNASFENKKRRKSITTFEMLYEQEDGLNENSQLDEKQLLKMKELLDKLSKYPPQALVISIEI